MANQPPVLPPPVELSAVAGAQSFSRSQIRKKFLADTLQEKTVLLPLAIGAAAVLYALIYAPVTGGALMSWLIAAVAGLVGGAVFVWRSVRDYNQGYNRKLQELAAQLEAENETRIEAGLQQARGDLERGFQDVESEAGLKILAGLGNEFRQLQPVIAQGAATDPLANANLAPLARETYIQGLKMLEHALELERAIGSSQDGPLREEIQNLEHRAAEAAQDPDSAESQALIQEKIGFEKERLGLVRKLHAREAALFHQAERCEASLNKTRIELAAMKADASDASVTSVIDTLQKTIERAREVQAELKKLGY